MHIRQPRDKGLQNGGGCKNHDALMLKKNICSKTIWWLPSVSTSGTTPHGLNMRLEYDATGVLTCAKIIPDQGMNSPRG